MEQKKNYKQFCNRECEFFPCHKDADPENFSCLFCYCPLFPLGDKCGGKFTYNKLGIKDCSECTMPHDPANYDKMMEGCGKVCREFSDKRRKRRRRLIWCAVFALIMGALCLALPIIGVQNMWRIAELIDSPEVTPVLIQLKEAHFIPAYIPAAVCAVLSFIISYRLKGHKITAFVLLLPIFVVCLITALMLTEVNHVPMYTMIGILLEYVRLGAF